MLLRPILRGKIGKWSLALTEFCVEYVSQKAIKEQALVDFLADHPCPTEQLELTKLNFCELIPYKLWFDSSKIKYSIGIGIVIESPNGVKSKNGFKVEKNPLFKQSN